MHDGPEDFRPLGAAIDEAGDLTDRVGEGLLRAMLITYVASEPKCDGLCIPPIRKAARAEPAA